MAFDADSKLVAASKDTSALVQKLGQNTNLLAMMVKVAEPFTLTFQRTATGSELMGDRPAIVFAEHLARRLDTLLRNRTMLLDANTLQTCVDEALEDALKHDLPLRLEGILQPIRPYSMPQLAYAQDLLDRENPLVFGIGPTGTGKTYLAIAAALNQLETGNVKHIVITKPHEIIRGEQMNADKRAEKAFDEQFDVYFDILNEFMGQESIHALIDQRHLEIAPLGLLRGRTLTDSILLIDEAQNVDKHWMRLAITRAGKGSRTFVTGDPNHSVLPAGETNGLAHLLQMIEGHNIGSMHRFTPKDIVRNDVVAQLEALYQQASQTDVELALQRD